MDNTHASPKQVINAAALAAVCVALVAMPELAFAQDVSGASTRVNSFFTNLNGLLDVASVAIVTIAVIFSGYQIAFNHKRIGDVAPVLIGGFLIGAAAQITKMLLPESVTSTSMLLEQVMTQMPYA
ncbi:TrbC/VirB2 family protein [Xanthomonas sp. XNM01]|uniref:TrbC/VirB2 family protein n=1 Tax=Xanthomonas sp. XNM01 TaxID=2769289 RepID=UPI00177E2D74|nr:TrbC/VirB2 family protein [Xanthomonas sp. XNM01]MBD9367746.1 TrbC/VirB2 family protein [Xanthomonas sp. XNM01]